jgi:hypothetical protein
VDLSGFMEGCDRRQPTLLPDCLDDYVAEDNPVRVWTCSSTTLTWAPWVLKA